MIPRFLLAGRVPV